MQKSGLFRPMNVKKTDENGKFVFRTVPEGAYTLVITSADTELTQETSMLVAAGQTSKPEIYVGTAQYRLDEVEVTGERDPKTVSKKSIQSQEITRLPGTGGDALRALPAIPGIGVANDFSGALYIRGGSDEDNLYYFDRVPVGYPYHFGGLVSSLSSEIIDRIDVYAGGYGAEYGVDSQAVIDIYSQDNSRANLGGKFNLNLLYSEGLLEGKIGENGFLVCRGPVEATLTCSSGHYRSTLVPLPLFRVSGTTNSKQDTTSVKKHQLFF